MAKERFYMQKDIFMMVFLQSEWDDFNFWIGEWADHQANGYGVIIEEDGEKYAGQWKNGKQDGHGTQTWPDGARYEGDYKAGKKHGKGKFV